MGIIGRKVIGMKNIGSKDIGQLKCLLLYLQIHRIILQQFAYEKMGKGRSGVSGYPL